MAFGERLVIWVASAKRDLLDMPQPVIREIGIAIGVAQRGGKSPSAKPWKGEGPGVLEIVNNFASNTFRAVYAVTFKEVVYVLHCFQKKSPRGSKTARTDVELIRERMNAAREDHRRRYEEKEAR
jgi:phage-related protein